jgi:hypothetical protein
MTPRAAPAAGLAAREIPLLASTVATKLPCHESDGGAFLEGLWYTRHERSKPPAEVQRQAKIIHEVSRDVAMASLEVRHRTSWQVDTGQFISPRRVAQLATPRMPLGDAQRMMIEERVRVREADDRKSARDRKIRQAQQVELLRWKEEKARAKVESEEAAAQAGVSKKDRQAKQKLLELRGREQILAYAEKKTLATNKAENLRGAVSSRRTGRWGVRGGGTEIDVMTGQRQQLSEGSFDYESGTPDSS